MPQSKVLVTGAGGFIGHHLVKRLRTEGCWVRGVDIKDIWGDGKQTRSFMYVEDCVEGLLRLMSSDYRAPLNLGTDRLISINELVDLISEIAGKRLIKHHDLSKPQGVRGRNSDNSRLRQVLGWEPSVSLEEGLTVTYRWIENELRHTGRLSNIFAARSAD